MKVTYGVKYPSRSKNMGPYVTAFYEFYDGPETSACIECDSIEEAIKCYKNIYCVKDRNNYPILLKRLDSYVYVEKVVKES